jgi:hypothetical protein
MSIVLGKVAYKTTERKYPVEKVLTFEEPPPVVVECPFTVSGTLDKADAMIGIAVNKLTGEVFQGDPKIQPAATSWAFKFDRLPDGNYALLFVGTKNLLRQEVIVGIGFTQLVRKVKGALWVTTPTPWSEVTCSFCAKGTAVDTSGNVCGEINGQRQCTTPSSTGDWALCFDNVTPSGLTTLRIIGDNQRIGIPVYVDPCPPTPSDGERPK